MSTVSGVSGPFVPSTPHQSVTTPSSSKYLPKKMRGASEMIVTSKLPDLKVSLPLKRPTSVRPSAPVVQATRSPPSA